MKIGQFSSGLKNKEMCQKQPQSTHYLEQGELGRAFYSCCFLAMNKAKGCVCLSVCACACPCVCVCLYRCQVNR